MIYAGIGSRKTPEDTLIIMRGIASMMARRGYILRSGRAIGADTAFEYGSVFEGGKMELFTADDSARNHAWFRHAAQYHPDWEMCGYMTRRLMARNSAIMLGADLQRPVNFVVCWTVDGKASGGTGQALRIAQRRQIPVFNLFADRDAKQLFDWLPPPKGNE